MPWAAIFNGMALCGLRPFGATFFVFTDYMRPSMRLAAIMGLPVILHLHPRFDRRGRGRPHASAHRASGRPAGDSRPAGPPAGRRQRGDRGLSQGVCSYNRPAALVLTRQNLPTLDRSKYAPANGLPQGGYVLSDAAGGRPRSS